MHLTDLGFECLATTLYSSAYSNEVNSVNRLRPPMWDKLKYTVKTSRHRPYVHYDSATGMHVQNDQLLPPSHDLVVRLPRLLNGLPIPPRVKQIIDRLTRLPDPKFLTSVVHRRMRHLDD